MYKQRGNPRFTVRLPQTIIDALKQLAQARSKTPSDILRDLAIEELKRAGYTLESSKDRDKEVQV